jgi:hypothetical protein
MIISAMEDSHEYHKRAEDASLDIPQDVIDSVCDIVDTVRTDGGKHSSQRCCPAH